MSLRNPLANSAASQKNALIGGAVGFGIFAILMARIYPQHNRFRALFENSDDYFRQEHPRKLKRSEKDY
ncbi:uncharacterized protein LODBEIA_P03320 [Lodderomyces beijingensis]|uniref:Uncharacterized protein n=1 Tax=Lodderomyces beijingensis TaxID=1775926 RepID=A0ABP0ZEU8_9ASCO